MQIFSRNEKSLAEETQVRLSNEALNFIKVLVRTGVLTSHPIRATCGFLYSIPCHEIPPLSAHGLGTPGFTD